MPRPTTRVLAVLELLQTHGRMSGAELARRIEVDGRTVRRYIAMLEELGIPITAERGRDGAYTLVAGFQRPAAGVTHDAGVGRGVGAAVSPWGGSGSTAWIRRGRSPSTSRSQPGSTPWPM